MHWNVSYCTYLLSDLRLAGLLFAAEFPFGCTICTYVIILCSPQNTVSGFCQWQGQEMCEKLKKYVDTNEQWVNSMVEQHGDSDPYWHQVQWNFASHLSGI